jgi:outer membrane protein insertion porin family
MPAFAAKSPCGCRQIRLFLRDFWTFRRGTYGLIARRFAGGRSFCAGPSVRRSIMLAGTFHTNLFVRHRRSSTRFLTPGSATNGRGFMSISDLRSLTPNHSALGRRWALAAAALAVAATCSLPAFGQGPPHSMPDPGTIFKKKAETREIPGLSAAATDEPVAEVRIVGNKLVPTPQILNEMQTRVGRPYDPVMVQRDVRKLATKSWFVSVEPQIQQTPAGRIVTIKVVERPSIRYVEYLGNKGIRDTKLAKETGLKVGGSIDPYEVEDARRKIIDLYKTSGYNDIQVTIMEGNKATDTGVVFVIDEGAYQKVWDVQFVGNTFVSGRRLKTQIQSKPPTLMIFSGFVDREKIDADVDRLTAYYRSFGFFQAKIGRKLEFNEKGNWLTLTFVVNEGPRYEVRNVSYMGNKLFAETSLGIGAKMLPGQPFEQAKMNGDTKWLKDLYGSQGYVFADIQAEPVFLEEPGKIDLLYHIQEGKQWRVGRIFVHVDGDNPHTRIQTALNRISLHPGQICDIREIHASERRLQASSLFLNDPAKNVSPKITYRIQGTGDEEVARGHEESFRGQSPDDSVPPAAGQATAPVGPATYTTYEVPTPPEFVHSDDMMDVELFIERPTSDAAASPTGTQSVSYPPAGAAEQASPATGPAPADGANNSAYRPIVVRTQSPYQQPTTQPMPASPYAGIATGAPNGAYSSLGQPPPANPANAYAATTTGGQAPAATGPESTPVGYNAQQVRPVQYAEPLPQPPGAPVGPMTVVPPGQPVGPPPGYYQNVPLPANPQLFPSGGPEPWAKTYDDPAVDLFVDTNEAQTGRLMLGVAVNSDAGLTGQILLDEQNFDWTRYPTSWDEFTSGRAFRGGGERFRIEAMPGTQVQRYVISFQEPYLYDTPISLGLSGSYFDRQYKDWTEQRAGGRVAFGYNWTADDVSTALTYRGEDVKIFNEATPDGPFPKFEEMKGDNTLHGFKLSVANDTRDSAFLATSGHYYELSGEQVLGSFTYPRAMLDARQYWLLQERPDHSGRQVISYAAQVGVTGANTPLYDNYFAGGFSTLRGYDFRGASPVVQGIQAGGQFMWVHSIEYLFPLTADDMMHGVVFTDFGTVEPNVELKGSDFRVAPGFGLRITIPAMGPAPIALDFAFPVHSAATDNKQIFSFNIGFNR